jgi:hypothetical protein
MNVLWPNVLKGACLRELAEAWRSRDNLAHLIRSDFVAAEPQ